jgi:outer membrane lipoprotein-sorting protein
MIRTTRMTRLAGAAAIALVLALAAPSALVAQDLSDGPEILARIDELSSFEGDLAAVMTMVSEDPEEGVDRQVVQQFRRDQGDMFLMLIQEPTTKLGQGYLLVDDNLWFYDPESRNFSHTSMKEEFADSDARNSDFGASSLAEDYETVAISEGRLGSYEVYILELEATSNEVTYPREVLWVTRDLYLPLKMEDYSETGRLMRTSLFPSYARAGDTYIATNMIFVDELVEGKKTQITITEISVEPLPDSIFTKAYVERVNR